MTIKDIAALAKVSVSTVSRVLNEHPDVSKENRQKVLSIIKKYHYIPNNTARSLVKTDSDYIGLVVRGISNPFYSDIIHSIEERISARGYTMVMQQISTVEDEIKCAAMMERDKRLQGIIFLGGRFDYTPREVSSLNVPFVCCSYSNQYGNLNTEKFSSVSIADEQEAYKAVLELYNNGHRRIAALIAKRDDKTISQLRYQGYLRALLEFGIEINPDFVICAGSYDINAAYEAVLHRVGKAFDFSAIFAISDMMAIGAIRALDESGYNVPNDCSIIAIDGISISDYITPRLTTLCQPTKDMGKKSVDVLLDIIENKGSHHHVVVPTNIRKGKSIAKI